MKETTDIRGPVPFYDGLFEWPVPAGTAPRLIASRCPSCGRHAFPAKRFCPFCQSGAQERALLSGRGRVYAFTSVDLPPKAMGKPYIAAYVDLEERVRVFAQIRDVAKAELKIGDPVCVSFRPLRVDPEGREHIGYTFVPAKEAAK